MSSVSLTYDHEPVSSVALGDAELNGKPAFTDGEVETDGRFALVRLLLNAPWRIALAILATKIRPINPRQPIEMVLPTLFFFGGVGWPVD